MGYNKVLKPTPESVEALRDVFRGGVGLARRYVQQFIGV